MTDLNGREIQVGDIFVPTAIGGIVTGFSGNNVLFQKPDGSPGVAVGASGYSDNADHPTYHGWQWPCEYKVCIP